MATTTEQDREQKRQAINDLIEVPGCITLDDGRTIAIRAWIPSVKCNEVVTVSIEGVLRDKHGRKYAGS